MNKKFWLFILLLAFLLVLFFPFQIFKKQNDEPSKSNQKTTDEKVITQEKNDTSSDSNSLISDQAISETDDNQNPNKENINPEIEKLIDEQEKIEILDDGVYIYEAVDFSSEYKVGYLTFSDKESISFFSEFSKKAIPVSGELDLGIPHYFLEIFENKKEISSYFAWISEDSEIFISKGRVKPEIVEYFKLEKEDSDFFFKFFK